MRRAIALCLLVACGASAFAAESGRQSRLRWGVLFDPGVSSPNLEKYRARVVEVATAAAGKRVKAVGRILSEGKLPNEPGVAESRAATSGLPTLLKLSVCARLAPEGAQRAACGAAAIDGLTDWAKTYQPTGNPINEMQLIPWVQAWDVMKPLLKPEQDEAFKRFALSLAVAGDSFYGGLKRSDGRYYNNWGTWRLCLRSLIAVVAQDGGLTASSQQLLAEHIARNLEPDGSSIDFHDRDALHYHVYDLEAFTELAVQVPRGFFSDADLAAVERGVFFLKPFYSGEKKHVEFAGSKVPFDIKRRQAGLADYQNAAWKPESARSLLRLARVAFPSVKAWTQNAVDEQYDPMLKLEAAAFGD